MNNITDDTQVDACLEHICQQGCRWVTHCIQQLKQGVELEETRYLTSVQKQKLLHELDNIMAVYQVTGSCQL